MSTRRETIRQCAIHQALHKAGIDRIADDGYFHNDDLMDDAAFHGISTDSIRWDYLREWIEETVGCELVPLSKEWFLSVRARKAKGIPPPEIAPEKYIAISGKTAVGFASVTTCDGKLALRKFQQKIAIANGTKRAVDKYRTMLTDQAVLAPPPPQTPLPLEDGAR